MTASGTQQGSEGQVKLALSTSLADVPDDIIRQILLYVPPEDNLAVLQLVCKRWLVLARDPVLWRRHCRTSFKFWNPTHRIAQRLVDRASEVGWHELWIQRKATDARNERLLRDLLSSKVGRLKKLGEICRHGYDAKDFLLEQLRTDDSVEDVLARR
jgi:F-box protein 21